MLHREIPLDSSHLTSCRVTFVDARLDVFDQGVRMETTLLSTEIVFIYLFKIINMGRRISPLPQTPQAPSSVRTTKK